MIEHLTLFAIQKQAEIGEFILGMFAVTWGIWLLLPMWDTFSYPSFASFLYVAPEHIWGLFALFLGLITILFASTKLFFVRKLMSLLHIAWWAFVSSMFVFAAPGNTAVPVYMMLSVYSFWRYVKLMICIELEDRFRIKKYVDYSKEV